MTTTPKNVTDELRQKANARKAGPQPEAKPPDDSGATVPESWSYRHHSEALPVLETRDFVEGLLIDGAFSVIFGAPNSGKSFLALDLAAAVASGQTWAEVREVEQGAVLYLPLEGGAMFANRVEVLRREELLDDADPLFLGDVTLDLVEGDPRKLIAFIEGMATAEGITPRLIVVDTLARAMPTGDENATATMNLVVANCDAVRKATGAHVMLVHHSGKDTAKGARGASSLKGALDTEIEVREDAEGLRVATVVKQRDMAIGDPMPFRLVSVELGTNQRGKMVTSCFIAHEPETKVSRGNGFAKVKPLPTEESVLALIPAAGVKKRDFLATAPKALGAANRDVEALVSGMEGRLIEVEARKSMSGQNTLFLVKRATSCDTHTKQAV